MILIYFLPLQQEESNKEAPPAAPSRLQIMGLKVEAHKRASFGRYELFTFILHHLLHAALGEAGWEVE